MWPASNSGPQTTRRASRRKGACTNHSGACFKNESCANWTNQVQCAKDCPKKDKCGNRFIQIGNAAFKGNSIKFYLKASNRFCIVGLMYKTFKDKVTKVGSIAITNDETEPNEYLAILPCIHSQRLVWNWMTIKVNPQLDL